MATPILPKAQSAIAGNLPTTREWLDFFRDLLDRVNEDEVLAAEIAAIILRLETLEGAAIMGPQSVQVFGSLSSGLVNLLLRGDVAAPGNTYRYGTGPTGIKGWFTVASAFTATQDGIALTTGSDGVTDITPDDDLAAIEALATTGFSVRTAANAWALRSFADSGTIGWTNPAGTAGNPSADFIGDSDDVPEGAINIYFTNERVDDRVAALIVDSATVTWVYDDAAGTLTATAVGGGDCCCEILVQDGSSAPPIMLTNEAEDDFLYSDC